MCGRAKSIWTVIKGWRNRVQFVVSAIRKLAKTSKSVLKAESEATSTKSSSTFSKLPR